MKTTFTDRYVIPFMTLLSGLSISAVAVWYSVAGLVAIFAASAVAIIIMGVVLEVGKLVTAIWLHRYWNISARWLKAYLSIAVIFLMFITSMGIFGFLSKAHIEQTSMSDEQSAQIETIDEKITRSDAKIKRWQEEMDRLLSGSTNTSTALVEGDQEALKDLRSLIKGEKDAVRAEADKRIATAQDRRDKEIAAAKPLLEDWGGEEKYNKEVAKAKQTEQNESSVARSDRDKKLAEIDKKYSKELNDLNKRINNVRADSGNKAKNADKRIKELEKNIEDEQKKIDVVREDKMVFEKEYRKLEAEVGPIKYIAEFIYGEADKTILEKAVTWVIILIIFVFDPLAIGLLIASQYAFQYGRPRDDGPYLGGSEPKYTPPDPSPKDKGGERPKKPEQQPEIEVAEKDEQETPKPLPIEPSGKYATSGEPITVGDTATWNLDFKQPETAWDEPEYKDLPVEKESLPSAVDDAADVMSQFAPIVIDGEVYDEEGGDLEPPALPPEESSLEKWNEWVEAAEQAVKEEQAQEDEQIIYDEESESVKNAMKRWKALHPESTIKQQKTLFEKGKIPQLPWIELLELEAKADFQEEINVEETKKKEKITWMEHNEQGQQIKKSIEK
jgi:hypothetical protein